MIVSGAGIQMEINQERLRELACSLERHIIEMNGGTTDIAYIHAMSYYIYIVCKTSVHEPRGLCPMREACEVVVDT